MANFEAIHLNFSSKTNREIGRGGVIFRLFFDVKFDWLHSTEIMKWPSEMLLFSLPVEWKMNKKCVYMVFCILKVSIAIENFGAFHQALTSYISIYKECWQRKDA